MKVTYEVQAKHEIIGKDWTAYRREKRGVTYIFNELWARLKTDTVPFCELREYLLEAKKAAKSKAYCSMNRDGDVIELNQYGVLPIIWIVENKEFENE